MEIKEITIKSIISLSERVAMTTAISNSYFSPNDETGEIEYVPYYRLISEILSFVDYYVEGVSFDKIDRKYDLVSSNEILVSAFDTFKSGNTQFQDILSDVKDIVEFKKQQLLQKSINVTTVSVLDEPIINFINTLSSVVETLPKTMDLKSLQPFIDKVGQMKNLDETKLANAVVKANSKGIINFLGHLKAKKNVKKVDKTVSETTETPTSTEV